MAAKAQPAKPTQGGTASMIKLAKSINKKMSYKLYLPVITILCAFFALYTPIGYRRLEEKNYPSNTIDMNGENTYPEGEFPKEYAKVDPYTSFLLSEASGNCYNYYNYYSQEGNTIDETLFNENNRILSDIREGKFEYYISLFKFYQLHKNYDLEKSAISILAKSENFQPSELLSYIEKSYLNKINETVADGHIEKAKKLIGLAYSRLYTFDPLPLDNVEYGDRVIIDKILLFNMLFNDPRLLLGDKKYLINYINLIETDFKYDYHKYLKIVVKQNYPSDISKYFIALNSFYDKKFEEAYKLFEYISNNSPNIPLSNLSKILQIRCIFWSQKQEQLKWLDHQSALSKMKEISENILKSSLKSDVPCYLDTLGSTDKIE